MCSVAGDEVAPEKSRRTQTLCLQGVATPLLSPPPWEVGRSIGHTLSDSAFLDQTLLCAPSLSVGVTRPVLTLAHGPAPAAFLLCVPPWCPSASGMMGLLPPCAPPPAMPGNGAAPPRAPVRLRGGVGDQEGESPGLRPPISFSVFSHFAALFHVPSCFYSHRPALSLLFSAPRLRPPALSFPSLPLQRRGALFCSRNRAEHVRAPPALSVACSRALGSALSPRSLFRQHGPEMRVGARALGWVSVPSGLLRAQRYSAHSERQETKKNHPECHSPHKLTVFIFLFSFILLVFMCT